MDNATQLEQAPQIPMADIRKKYPMYGDMSDGQLLEGVYRKFYSDMPRQDFMGRIANVSPDEGAKFMRGDSIPGGGPQLTLDQRKALALAAARLRLRDKQQQPATTEPATMERVQASAPLRLIQGLRDPIDAGAQLLAHVVPESVTAALDYLPAKMRNSDSPLLQTIGESFFADPRAKPTDERLRQTEAEYQRARAATSADPGADVARFTGNVLSPVNATLARYLPMGTTTLGRAAAGTLAGGTGGALTPVTGDDEVSFAAHKVGQVALGGATGMLATPIIGKVADVLAPKVNALIGRMTGGAQRTEAAAAAQTDELIKQALGEVGGRPEDVPPAMLQGIRQQVSDALRAGKKLDAAALLRKQDFEALNVPPTLGQITRDPTQYALERNLRGTDPRLAARFNDQSRRLADALTKYGASADEPQAAGQKFVSHLAGVDRAAGAEVSRAYEAARQSTGREFEVPLQGLAQDMERISQDYGNALPGAIRSRLASFGLFDGKQTKAFTANDAELLLQQVNKLRGSDRATNNALSEVSQAVKRAITAADQTGGAFAGARELAAGRFKAQEMVPALRASADGDASADRFVGRFLLRGETGEVQRLAKLLKLTSPELYDQARAQFGQELLRSAYGENAAGDAAIKPQAMAKALRQFGTDKLRAFFSADELTQLNRIARVGAYIESAPAASPVNTSNTLTAALPFLAKIPGAGFAGNALRIGAALGRSIGNARSVNSALRAELPPVRADVSPEVQRQLARALLLGTAGTGMALGQAINPPPADVQLSRALAAGAR